MPVLGEATFEAAVQKVMRQQNVNRSSAEKIVGSAEKKQKKARLLKLRMAAVGISFDEKMKRREKVNKPKKTTQGKELYEAGEKPKYKEMTQRRLKQEKGYINSAAPIRPTKTDMKIDTDIKRKLAQEQRLAKEHGHAIVFKGIPHGPYKTASLNQQSGRYAKYWLLNAKQTNGNGWGIAAHTAKDNMKKFLGRPLVVTSASWHGASEYGNSYEHPYLPTNDLNKIFDHQEKFRVGSIVDVQEDKAGDWYATIEMLPKFANMNLPPFCSPAIYQLDASEHEGQISKWEALHLAALDENPAYGARIALLKGSCVGTKDSCTVQFKSAKLNDKDLLKLNRALDKPGASKRIKELDNYYDKNPRNPMYQNEAYATTNYVSNAEKINPSKYDGNKITDKLRKKLAKQLNATIYDEDVANTTKKQKKKKMFDKNNPKFRGIMEAQVVCPKKVNEIKGKIANLKKKQKTAIVDVREPFKFAPPKDLPKLHPQSSEIQTHATKLLGTSPTFKGSHFLTTDGKLLGTGKSEHRTMSHNILRTFKDKKFNEMAATADAKTFSRWGTDGRNMNDLLRQTGMSRVSADDTGINIDAKHPLTSAQRKTILQHITDKGITSDNVFVDDYTPAQGVFKQLRLGSLKSKTAIVRSPDKPQAPREMKHTRVDSAGPLINKVPFGDEDRSTTQQYIDRQMRNSSYELSKGKKVYPPKPTQKDRKRIIKAKLASLGEQNMTYQNSKKVKIHKKKHPEVRKAKGSIEDILRKAGSSVDGSHHQSTFLSKSGDFIGGGDIHDIQIRNIIDPTGAYGETVTNNFIKEHGLGRVQTFPINRAGERKTSVHFNSKATPAQIRAVKDLEASGRNIGYLVGDETGSGSRDFIRALGRLK